MVARGLNRVHATACSPPMHLSELFRPQDLLIPFEPADKWDAIKRLAEHAVHVGRLPQESLVETQDAVYARERSMSTGMEHGIAIPHAALDDLEKVSAVMGVVQTEDGLNFESIDGSHTHLVILLVIPRKQKLLHIRTLADIARGLGRESLRTNLLEASDSKTAWQVLESAT